MSMIETWDIVRMGITVIIKVGIQDLSKIYHNFQNIIDDNDDSFRSSNKKNRYNTIINVHFLIYLEILVHVIIIMYQDFSYKIDSQT